MAMLERIKKKQWVGLKEFVESVEVAPQGQRPLILLNGILEDPRFMQWVTKNMKGFQDVLNLPTDELTVLAGSHETMPKVLAKALAVAPEEIGGLAKIFPRHFSKLREEIEFLSAVPAGEREAARNFVLKAVRKLLPGEAMVLRDGKIERRFTWYQLPAFRGVARDLDERASVEGTERFVRAAVQRQMVADVPVGAFLSGGLDSSAVVAFARETAPDLQCFTIRQIGGAEQGVTDDLPYAEKVAKHLGVRLHTVEIEASRMAGDLERMIWQLDEPLADPAPLNVLYICELARKSGMKVLLSGAGGDDLFTGYRRHRAVELERWWSWLPAGVPNPKLVPTSTTVAPTSR
jgi:asparagine synthetase B (glutamine-hydrolysing)